MDNVNFPLSEENQDKYYDHSEIDTNGTTYEVYKIDGKCYDVLGNEVQCKINEDKEVIDGNFEGYRNKPFFDAHTSLAEINKIVELLYNLMQEAGLKPSDIVGTGAIYYRNGNDGTDFDWSMNDRTCEFMMFYNTEEQLGFAKVWVDKQGNLGGYTWDDEGHGEGKEISVSGFTQYPEEFAALCFEQADMKGLFDAPINQIKWDEPVKNTSYDWLYDYEDDEEWEEEEWEDMDY